ncbi:MAG: ATP-binding protein [Halarcobacter sp.]
MTEIKNTKLYKELKRLNKEFANDVLKNSNSIIELINKKTTINFPNYTNHDIRHSIKIMETIYELIKDKNKQFSSIEYALMIYSAMFHDIGMAVSDEEITNIKNDNSKYLYDQSFQLIKESFNNNEELSIQEVVRNAHGKIANDLINTKYKELFKLPQSSTYFAEDLGMICQAHTEDKNYLNNISIHKTKGYDEYNPRFIAILLRVADILDIDDSRTPIELYNTIDLSEFSDSEWQKNFVIENKRKIFSRNKLKEIRLEGTCEDIKVHRKLLNYIKWIENELSIVVNETANMKEQYHIQINTQVQNKIESKGYSIPDLKLNMDYHAVTNLLMGEAIYGSKDLGLRELLQNSIDAIMVKKDKLERENHPLKNNYEPTININIDEENNKVIIKDNGMGMNEHIIKNYFLNVGKSYYKSKDFLNYNHNYNPIGNFGIGFLSCFMLSDEVQVITKHFNSNKKYIIDLEKDSEYIAFKEEEDNSSESGTEITLSLKTIKEIFPKLDTLLKNNIKEFIKKYINIENFIINIDGNKLIQEKEAYRTTEYIDLSNVFKNIKGFIQFNIKPKYNKIIDLIDNSYESYYFDANGTFIKINQINELNLNYLFRNNSIDYCKIPLLDKIKNKNILSIIEHTDEHNLENELNIEPYICIFTNIKFDYAVYNTFNGNFIRTNENDFYYNFELQNFDGTYTYDFLKKKIKALKLYKTPIAFVKEIPLIFNENQEILFLKEQKISSSYFIEKQWNIYLKNIRIEERFKFYTTKNIEIINFEINLYNDNLQSDIKRKELVKSSKELLEDALFKTINQYVLEKTNLENYEKKILLKFLKKMGKKENILLLN